MQPAGGRYCVHGLKRNVLLILKFKRMKKFQFLGKKMDKNAQRKISGGFIEEIDDGKPCGGKGVGSVCSVSCGGETYLQSCCGACSVTDNIIYCDGKMYYNC